MKVIDCLTINIKSIKATGSFSELQHTSPVAFLSFADEHAFKMTPWDFPGNTKAGLPLPTASPSLSLKLKGSAVQGTVSPERQCVKKLNSSFPYLLDSRYMGPGWKHPRAFDLHGGFWENIYRGRKTYK